MSSDSYRTSLTVTLSIGVLFVTAVVLLHGKTQRRAPRTVSPSGPIMSLIRSDDSDLTVVRKYNRPLKVLAPRGSSPVAWELSNSSALLVRLDYGRPVLSAEQDWIWTNWSAKVLEILRLVPGHPFKLNAEFGIRENQGDLTIGSVPVHAINPWENRLMAGHEYLMFLDVINGAVVTDAPREYEILSDGSLEHVDKMQDDLSKMTLSDVRAQIASWAKQHGR